LKPRDDLRGQEEISARKRSHEILNVGNVNAVAFYMVFRQAGGLDAYCTWALLWAMIMVQVGIPHPEEHEEKGSCNDKSNEQLPM